MNGFLNLAKPLGMTSHDAVARVRRIVGRAVKVGHAGTLDPAASGVLPIALGSATRLIEYLTDAPKGYRATVRLGQTTTTDDAEGEILSEQLVPELLGEALEAALEPFRGAIMQVPPAFSALHINGQRAYDLARQGKPVDLAPREVTIFALVVEAIALPEVVLRVECSKGTYIRALARDLGAALGCGGHLGGLVRTFVGGLRVEAALPLARLDREAIQAALLPPVSALDGWPQIVCDAAALGRLRNGLPIGPIEEAANGLHAAALDQAGNLVAVLRPVDGQWWPHKVLG